ncbi:hypothetical protein ASE17_20345 [Phenylobacterium sp. Root77]|jgi:hypothetical protein|nr:hypothetical protein ASC73_18260 [Phenylobacterium sp. Root1277]KQW89763.1 hypothetical protein ASC79_19165 [Phenylobacterium sp. Root1290]KRC43548.1 hypothetical protein ASE17_20345 [Phenylobacterium sp. Root77]
MASALGAGLILAGEAVVSGFYNWRMRDHLLVSGLLMAGGLLLGLLLHARLMSLNSRAGRSSELTSIMWSRAQSRRASARYSFTPPRP